jgi:hypothetical protein
MDNVHLHPLYLLSKSGGGGRYIEMRWGEVQRVEVGVAHRLHLHLHPRPRFRGLISDLELLWA